MPGCLTTRRPAATRSSIALGESPMSRYCARLMIPCCAAANAKTSASVRMAIHPTRRLRQGRLAVAEEQLGPGEAGWAFGLVRGQALGRVRAAEAEELVGERRVERRAHGAVPVVQRVLRPAKRVLRPAGQRDGDLERARLHVVVVDGYRHEADALGLLTRERLARQQVVLGLCHPAQERPADRGVISGRDTETS